MCDPSNSPSPSSAVSTGTGLGIVDFAPTGSSPPTIGNVQAQTSGRLLIVDTVVAPTTDADRAE